jgi:broad specificity phosphatase PhoE
VEKEHLALVLVRHGLTDWNESGRLMGRQPIPLNERGRSQAESVATELRDVPVQRILCSPQRRAQETAAPISQALGCAVETEPGLDEVWLTRWQGKTFAELRDDPEVWRYFREPGFVSDAFEPTEEIRKRVVSVIETLRQGPGGVVVLVSHGDPLRIGIAHYLGLPLERYRSLAVLNGAISVLRFGPYRDRLMVLNAWPSGGGLASQLRD